MIGYCIGRILLTEAALLLLPVPVALLCGESPLPFLWAAAAALVVGLLLSARKPKRATLFARDGFAVVALAWILLSAFGALPFVLSGDIPHVADAFFETVSGLTTTGATILTAVEPLSRSGLFWRSFTHWVGGMGVLVFVMAVLPMSGGQGMHLMRAEVPGPSVGKLVSRMGDTAKILYGIYAALTVVLIVLLMLGGMNLFDAAVHAFGTAGTGGFSSRNLSVGAYNSLYFDILIGVFMLIFGVNFNLYYFLLMRKFRDVFRSEELRIFLVIVAASSAVIALNVMPLYGSFGTALRHAFFQVSSIITTTGYATVDFNLWPTFSKTVLLVLMFVGGCAGSTAGGLKVGRILILGKAAVADGKKMLHPNAVPSVRFEGKPLEDRTVRGAYQYIAVYVLILGAALLLLSLEGFSVETTVTSVITCFNNVGPGLDMTGPMGNFSAFSPAAKILLSFVMLLGRLEIFPMLLLFAPSIWRRRRRDPYEA